MRARDTVSTLVSALAAVLLDGTAIFGGFLLALWIRFQTGWIPLRGDMVAPPMQHAMLLSGIATLLALAVFQMEGLFKRPQYGRFEDKIPRIVKCLIITFVVYFALEAALRLDPPFSRMALLIATGTTTLLVLLERYLVYRIEWNLARHMPRINRVLVVGTDRMADQVAQAILKEPFLRAEVIGFLRGTPDQGTEIPEDQVCGELADFGRLIHELKVNQVILSDLQVHSEKKIDLAKTCAEHFIHFSAVPDLFTSLAGGVEIVNLGGVPLISMQKWPLDYLHRRILKRAVDVLGALLGLLLSSPVILVCSAIIRATSPGPVFYRQVRCGKNGQEFTLYKLRTMQVDAEQNGPGWTREDDPRRTRFGTWLRALNLDELPQFWNVLLGQMSLVGPRPERPVYVAQFRDEIDRYMQRHVSLPGMTGWAQVNGLRGDTSIADRIHFDLYYLENWSLSFDFKILLKTLTTTSRNAY